MVMGNCFQWKFKQTLERFVSVKAVKVIYAPYIKDSNNSCKGCQTCLSSCTYNKI